MADCCESKSFDGASLGYRRALYAVIAINSVMFVTEMTAGFTAGSHALKADALDFAGDSATYAISLAVIGASLRTRARASLFKGASLAAIAMLVLATAAIRFFSNTTPHAETMGLMGTVALGANLLSVVILLKWRDGDSNVRSVWLCSRNDAIGNLGVIGAGGLVALVGSSWPDLLVAVLLASLFFRSAWSIIIQAWGELESTTAGGEPRSIGRVRRTPELRDRCDADGRPMNASG